MQLSGNWGHYLEKLIFAVLGIENADTIKLWLGVKWL